MYSTAVGLIRYAYMEDVFFGYEEEPVGSPQSSDSIYEVAEPLVGQSNRRRKKVKDS